MRLAPPKMPLFFLKLAAVLLGGEGGNCENLNNLYFAVVGDGPLQYRCQEYIKEHNLGERVFMPGTRDDLPEIYSGFDIFTLFSSHEGLPLTVIEAMLAGLPVVAGNAGGVGEMVVHGETGYLVNGFDVKAAAGYIEELARDPALRREMGAAGRKRALEMFSLDRMIRQYEELYSGRL
jgi:glycosyltransferase involved in cell wall biosynthesis